MSTIGDIHIIQLLRAELTDTKELSEEEIRSLSGELGDNRFLRELWEDNLIHFKKRPHYKENAIISIEIPEKSNHFYLYKKDERQGPIQVWMIPDEIKDHTIKAIISLQTAIDDYNKIKAYTEILKTAQEVH